MDDERAKEAAAPAMAQQLRSSGEARFWSQIATDELLQRSQPPPEFPAFAVQPHDEHAYRRVSAQVHCE